MIRCISPGFVNFTGSVAGSKAMEVAAGTFTGLGLELA